MSQMSHLAHLAQNIPFATGESELSDQGASNLHFCRTGPTIFFNRYVYVMNSPLRLVDPTGLQAGNHSGAVYYKVMSNGAWAFSDRGGKGYDTRYRGPRKDIVGVDGYQYTVRSNGWSQGRQVADGRPVVIASASQGISTSVTSPGEDPSRALINDLAARAPALKKTIAVLAASGVVGGLSAVPAAAAGGGTLLATAVGEGLLAEQAIRQSAEAAHEMAIIGSVESDRRAAVRDAWQLEAEAVRNGGEGSHPWTPEQRQELIETGKVKGFQGHHINSVHDNPEMARDPRNIRLTDQHLAEHGGNWRNPTRGPLIHR